MGSPRRAGFLSGRGGVRLLVCPLLGPLPARSSQGEDAELDAALAATFSFGIRSGFFVRDSGAPARRLRRRADWREPRFPT